MLKRVVIFIIILSLFLTSFLIYETTDALSFNIIRRITDAIKAVTNFLKNINTAKVISPFGGRITKTGKACTIHYWMTEPPFFIPHPGFPIPIGGTKINVGPPGITAKEIFTFPFISQIYSNHHENRVGAWTLGLTFNKEFFKKRVLDPINDALDQIPPISVGLVTFFNFSLSCPDGGVIYKIGTS